MCDHYSDDILSLTKSNKEFASKCLKRRKEGGRGVNAFLENVKKCRMGSGYCGGICNDNDSVFHYLPWYEQVRRR